MCSSISEPPKTLDEDLFEAHADVLSACQHILAFKARIGVDGLLALNDALGPLIEARQKIDAALFTPEE